MIPTRRRDEPSADAEDADVAPGAEWHAGWARIAVALVLAGQGMSFGLAANISPPETAAVYWVLHGGLFASAVAVLALLGGPLVRECTAALRSGRITVDLLFMVTLGGALGVSVYSTLRRDGPVFYELVAILLSIYTVGKLLGAKSRSRALRAVQRLRAEHDSCVAIAADGSTRRVAVDAVKPGDLVRIGPGETVSVDGTVEVGEGLVWTTPLTGEPDPRAVGPGDRLLAGMRSADGVFSLRVTAAAGQRRLDAMLQEIERAQLRPSRLQAAADRLAARFVPLVVATSVATFGAWWWAGGVAPAIENGLAVLVVACPCALGLATPLGIWAGLVQLGRLGIVARSGDFLDGLAEAGVALFDKTGTLCEPGLRVSRVRLVEPSPVGGAELRAMLAAAEQGVDHPVAEALREVGPASGDGEAAARFEARETRIVPGRGIRAIVRGRDGTGELEVLAGTEALVRESGIALPPEADGAPRARRRIFVAVERKLAAVVELDERPRERAAEVFARLRAAGLRVEILTGDVEFPAGIWPDVPRRTGMAPEEKAQRVRALQREGARVLFVGDGLNDAPALAAADVSVALRHGAELARSHSLAVVAGDNLGMLPAAVEVARRVKVAIRSNLIFSAVYNCVGMAIAAAGWLHPVLAALLMAGSSAIVSARVLRAAGRQR